MLARWFFVLVALLLGHLLSFGQATPFRGGLLIPETNLLPQELTQCAKIAFYDSNAKEAFLMARTCSGDVRIYRSVRGSNFTLVARQADFEPYQLLSWALPLFGPNQDFYVRTDMELRPKGLYFTLMVLPPSGTAVNSGEGGSYAIIDGKLEKILTPGDTITFKYGANQQRTVQIESASMPYAKSDGGEFFFLKTSFATSGPRVSVNGIFAKKGSAWTQILPFQVGPINGINTAYGLGQIVPSFRITEALDGSISFLQRWSSLSADHFEFMSYDPRTDNLRLILLYGAPILGMTNDYPSPRLNTDTNQLSWIVLMGQLGNRQDGVLEAPNPTFKNWRWIISSKLPEYNTLAFDMRGMSDYLASYLLIKERGERGSAFAIWDGTKLNYMFSNGDTLPGGMKVTSIGNSFLNENSFAPVSNCTVRFATYNNDNTIQSLWRFEKPCITDAVADSAQVVLYGFNLSFPGYTPTILIDGVPVSGATITANRISFPTAGIPSGTRKVQIKMANGEIYSNETSVLVPLTTPPPAITSVTTAKFTVGPVSPGSWVSIFGTNMNAVDFDVLIPYKPGITDPSSYPLPTTLGGSRVSVNGQYAPIAFSAGNVDGKGKGQINFQMPIGVTGETVRIKVERCADLNCSATDTKVSSVEYVVPLKMLLPVNLGMLNYNKANQPVVIAPAEAGNVITVYFTGYGQTSPLIPEGVTPESVTGAGKLVVLQNAVDVWFEYTQDGKPAYYLTKTLDPAVLSPRIAGLAQANVEVPDIKPDPGTDVFFSMKMGDMEEKTKLPFLTKQ